MENIGTCGAPRAAETWEAEMISFYGQDRGTVDSNGRLKLSADFCRSLRQGGIDEVTLFGLPEGGIGVYPASTWEQFEEQVIRPAAAQIGNLASRRTLRLFCARTRQTKVTGQGRITLPDSLREYAGISCGDTVIQAGVGVGLEIWAEDQWGVEAAQVGTHATAKGEAEMALDLPAPDAAGGGADAS